MTEHFCDLQPLAAVGVGRAARVPGLRRRRQSARPPAHGRAGAVRRDPARGRREARRTHVSPARPRRAAQGDDPDRRVKQTRSREDRARRSHRDLRGEFEDRLAALVEVPTVSMDPARRAEMDAAPRSRRLPARARRARRRHRDRRLSAGVGRSCAIRRGRRSRSTTTSTCSRPTGPEWRTPPFSFTPRRRGRRWFGRGTTDDKGPALTALYGARLALEEDARVNIQFLWELEEEIGSPHFERGLAAAIAGDGAAGRAAFTTDSVVVSDTIWIAAGQPAIAYGLRGLMGFTVASRPAPRTCTRARRAAPRATRSASWRRSSPRVDARTGRVKIPGFYDDVRKTAAEKKAFGRAGFSRGASRRRTSSPACARSTTISR